MSNYLVLDEEHKMRVATMNKAWEAALKEAIELGSRHDVYITGMRVLAILAESMGCNSKADFGESASLIFEITMDSKLKDEKKQDEQPAPKAGGMLN